MFAPVRLAILRQRAWAIGHEASPTAKFNGSIVHVLTLDRSPCLSRLNFRPFHPQPPHHHFTMIDLARYVTVMACLRLSPETTRKSRGTTSHRQGFAVCQLAPRQVWPNQVHFRYGLVILLRLLLTLSHENAITTVGFRRVTFAWKGLPPF